MPIVHEGVHFSLRFIKGSLTTFNHSLEPSCEFDANWHHFFKMMPIGIILSVIINDRRRKVAYKQLFSQLVAYKQLFIQAGPITSFKDCRTLYLTVF